MKGAPRYKLLTQLTQLTQLKLLTLLILVYCSNCFTLHKHKHACLYILLEEVKTLLKLTDALLSKKLEGLDSSGYPLDCYDY